MAAILHGLPAPPSVLTSICNAQGKGYLPR